MGIVCSGVIGTDHIHVQQLHKQDAGMLTALLHPPYLPSPPPPSRAFFLFQIPTPWAWYIQHRTSKDPLRVAKEGAVKRVGRGQ